MRHGLSVFRLDFYATPCYSYYISVIIPLQAPARAEYERKEILAMNNHAENVTLLYLMNQDTKDKSLDELYTLYRETLEKVRQSEKRYLNPDNKPAMDFK